jgi:hypothetical protein
MSGKKRTLLDYNDNYLESQNGKGHDSRTMSMACPEEIISFTTTAKYSASNSRRTHNGAPMPKVQRTKYQEQLPVIRTVLGTPGILPSIFSFLSTRTKLSICTSVCKEWAAAVNDSLSWHTISISAESSYDSIISFEEACSFLGCVLRGIRKLELDHVFSGDKIQTLLNRCPNVETVRTNTSLKMHE